MTPEVAQSHVGDKQYVRRQDSGRLYGSGRRGKMVGLRLLNQDASTSSRDELEVLAVQVDERPPLPLFLLVPPASRTSFFQSDRGVIRKRSSARAITHHRAAWQIFRLTCIFNRCDYFRVSPQDRMIKGLPEWACPCRP